MAFATGRGLKLFVNGVELPDVREFSVEACVDSATIVNLSMYVSDFSWDSDGNVHLFGGPVVKPEKPKTKARAISLDGVPGPS